MDFDHSQVCVNDVLCGRNKIALNHVGNRRFRILVSLSLHRYVDVTATRKDKANVIQSIFLSITECGGRFLQIRNGEIMQLSEKQAYEKIGHAIRDMVALREVKDTTWMGTENETSTKSATFDVNNNTNISHPRTSFSSHESNNHIEHHGSSIVYSADLDCCSIQSNDTNSLKKSFPIEVKTEETYLDDLTCSQVQQVFQEFRVVADDSPMIVGMEKFILDCYE